MLAESFRRSSFGLDGSILVTAGPDTGRFSSFHVTTAGDFTWSVDAGRNGDGDETFTSVTLPAGTTIYGDISSITAAASGVAVAYLYIP